MYNLYNINNYFSFFSSWVIIILKKYKQWTLKGRKLEVDLCGAKSKTSDSRANIETSTVSLKVNCEFDLDDLSDIFTDPCDIRIPVKGPNIAYIQFEDKETAKKYFNKNLEVNGEPIAMKYVPDRITVVPKREKGNNSCKIDSLVNSTSYFYMNDNFKF